MGDGGGKYRRDRKREKLNEEKNNKKTKITVSITRTNADSLLSALNFRERANHLPQY